MLIKNEVNLQTYKHISSIKDLPLKEELINSWTSTNTDTYGYIDKEVPTAIVQSKTIPMVDYDKYLHLEKFHIVTDSIIYLFDLISIQKGSGKSLISELIEESNLDIVLETPHKYLEDYYLNLGFEVAYRNDSQIMFIHYKK